MYKVHQISLERGQPSDHRLVGARQGYSLSPVHCKVAAARVIRCKYEELHDYCMIHPLAYYLQNQAPSTDISAIANHLQFAPQPYIGIQHRTLQPQFVSCSSKKQDSTNRYTNNSCPPTVVQIIRYNTQSCLPSADPLDYYFQDQVPSTAVSAIATCTQFAPQPYNRIQHQTLKPQIVSCTSMKQDSTNNKIF